ncbi:outer membrane beta-barrel protein [candidate division KSB1 bacterium]|nr:outer membrane beta-barrel protein [candidate division KSB1 bacterium]
MKRMQGLVYGLLLGISILWCLPETGLAQRRYSTTTLKLGYFNPKDASSGFIIGGNYGLVMDETVDVGLGLDFFRKTYRKETTIATQEYAQGVSQETKQLEIEMTTLILPIMANISAKIPISSYNRSAFLLVSGGLGWELMFNTENNYKENKKESRFYHGFGYMLGVGALYQIGTNSGVLAELGYNGCRVSRNQKKVESLPVWDEVNISGFLFRVGIRLGII